MPHVYLPKHHLTVRSGRSQGARYTLQCVRHPRGGPLPHLYLQKHLLIARTGGAHRARGE